MNDSTIYTIGTALNRALARGIPVQVLVEGSWLSGQVAGVDGHGVVLNGTEAEHWVIRIESIAAVKVLGEVPDRVPLPAGVMPMPMPGARHAHG